MPEGLLHPKLWRWSYIKIFKCCFLKLLLYSAWNWFWFCIVKYRSNVIPRHFWTVHCLPTICNVVHGLSIILPWFNGWPPFIPRYRGRSRSSNTSGQGMLLLLVRASSSIAYPLSLFLILLLSLTSLFHSHLPASFPHKQSFLTIQCVSFCFCLYMFLQKMYVHILHTRVCMCIYICM